MIEVSSIRTSPKEESANEKLGKVYDETRSRVPLAFGLGLTALLLYLKSFLPGMSGAAEAAELPEGPASNAGQEPAAPHSAAQVEPTEPMVEQSIALAAHEALNLAEGANLANVNLPPIGPMPAGLPWVDRSGPLPIRFPSAAEIAVFRPTNAGTGFNPIEFAPEIEDGALDGYGSALQLDSAASAARNRAPNNRGPVQLNSLASGGILAIALSDLLAQSSDGDGDDLDVALVTASRGRIVEDDGGWFYIADPNYLGTVEISYLVHDGDLAVEQLATLNIEARSFIGTVGTDNLRGSAARDAIDAGAGDDLVAAGAAADTVSGGDGNDKIDAGGGDDLVYGGMGDDLVYGAAGNDEIYGGGGNDTLLGEAGDDTVSGDAGDDEVDGGDGNDLLSGGDGNDKIGAGAGNDVANGDAGNDVLTGNAGNDGLTGGAGNDSLLGDDGNDTLMGGDGADVLTDGTGADLVDGGAGDDFIVVVIDQSSDMFNGGAGSDALDLSKATDALIINLDEQTVTYVDGVVDTFREIEAISGGAGDDLVILSGYGVTIAGGGGSDIYEVAPAGDHSSLLQPVIETACQILDFGRDDRVSVADYDIFDRLADALEDQFEDLFDSTGHGGGGSGPRIRYSHDVTNDIERTVIEVDYDYDNYYEAQVVLDGFHQLVLVEGV